MRFRRTPGMRALTLLLSVLLVSPTVAVEIPVEKEDTTPRWMPSVYAGTKIGNDRIIGQLGALGPVHQDERSLWFMDVRARVMGQTDKRGSGEGNFGLGYRRIFGDDQFMLGGYAYFDVLRSSNNNTFVQGTVGLELNTEFWSLRGNGYIPEDRDQVNEYLGSLSEGAQIIDNEVKIVSGLGLALVERSIPGFDVELGRRFPLFDQDLWLYAAYYRFDGEGVPVVSGPRLRAEFDFDLSRWAKNTTLVVGGEWQRDDVRGSHGYGSLEFRFAFGGDRAKGVRRVENERWTDRRMVSRVVRDIDIVTSKLVVGEEQEVTDALNPDTGVKFGKVVFVRDSAVEGATGTEDDPALFSESAGLVTGGNGLIIVQGDDGEILTDGVDLGVTHSGLRLVGGGAFVDASDEDGTLYRFRLPGTSPTLVRNATSDCTTGSLSLVDGDCAIINADGVEDLLIEGLTIKDGGILLKNLGGDRVMQDITIEDSAVGGVAIVGSGGTIVIRSLTVNDSTGTAVEVQDTDDLVLLRNLVIQNMGAGTGSGLMVVRAKLLQVDQASTIHTTDAPILHVTGTDTEKTLVFFDGLVLEGELGSETSDAVKLDYLTGSARVTSLDVNRDETCTADMPENCAGLSITNSALQVYVVEFNVTGGKHGVYVSEYNCEDESDCGAGISLGGSFDDIVDIGGGTISDTASHAIVVSDSDLTVQLHDLELLNSEGNGVDLKDNTGFFFMVGGLIDFTGAVGDTQVGVNATNVKLLELSRGFESDLGVSIIGAGGGAVRVENAEEVLLQDFAFRDIGVAGGNVSAVYLRDITKRVTITSNGRNTIENVEGRGIVIDNTEPIANLSIMVNLTEFKDISGTAISATLQTVDEADAAANDLLVEIVGNFIEGVDGDGIFLDYTGGSGDRPAMNGVELIVALNTLVDVEGTGITVRTSAGIDSSVEIGNLQNGRNEMSGRYPGFCHTVGKLSCDAADEDELTTLIESQANPDKTIRELIKKYDLNDDGVVTAGLELLALTENIGKEKVNSGYGILVEIDGDLFHPLDTDFDGDLSGAELLAEITRISMITDGEGDFIFEQPAEGEDPVIDDPELYRSEDLAAAAFAEYVEFIAEEVELDLSIQSNFVSDFSLGGIRVQTLGDGVGGKVNATVLANIVTNIADPVSETVARGIEIQTSGNLDLIADIDGNALTDTLGFLAHADENQPDSTLRVNLHGNMLEQFLVTDPPTFRFETQTGMTFQVVCDSVNEPECPTELVDVDDFVKALGRDQVVGGTANTFVTLDDEGLETDERVVEFDEVEVDFGGTGVFELITELP